VAAQPNKKALDPKARKRRWKKGLLIAGATTFALSAGFVLALHELPWFGPAVADGVRSVVGPGPVAWAEDVVYGVEDWFNVRTQSDAAPKKYWEPQAVPEPIVVTTEDGKKIVIDPMKGAPPAFEPPFPKVASEVDGRWFPMRAASDTGDVTMWKSMVHPDPKRPFAAVAIAAMDLQKLELHLQPGTDEPKSQQVRRSERPGIVPDDDQKVLVAAFNGGFKAMHGNYGMRIADKQYLPPRDFACTVLRGADASLQISTFSALKGTDSDSGWYRQTPPCLIENGEPNKGLLHEFNKNWGAAVGGDTIIRRSAIGLSKDKRYLFYALGDATTAQSIGRAIEVVGAHDAAQLDVNYSYPRFFVFERGITGASIYEPIIDDIKYSPAEYVGTPSQRDFFYVTKKKNPS
jgi:hypothetical protein